MFWIVRSGGSSCDIRDRYGLDSLERVNKTHDGGQSIHDTVEPLCKTNRFTVTTSDEQLPRTFSVNRKPSL
jgi:hypothetical protein